MEARSSAATHRRARLAAIALLVALGVIALGSRAFGSFDAAVNYAVGDGPQSLAAGDLNGDGHLDLVTANTNPGNITILLGNGAGSFTEADESPVSAGGNPRGVAIGNLDGDPDPDLAVATNFPHQVSILPGDGDGTFGPRVDFATNTNDPRKVAIGNFDGDGDADLAVTYLTAVKVSILLNDGDAAGGFLTEAAGSPFAVPSSPFGVAVGDFNGGSPDLVVGSQLDDIYVLLGNGDGTFAAAPGSPIEIGTNAVPQSVAAGNLDGDAFTDLAAASRDQDKVSVLTGNGDGTFDAPADHATGSNPEAVAIANVNGGSVPDLVVANAGERSGLGNENADTVSVLLGDGTGDFGLATNFTVADKPASLAVGGFNADSLPDIAVANEGNANVSVLLGTTAPTASVAPVELDFPLQEQGTTSAPQTITVTNTSDDDQVEIGSVVIADQHAGDFAITGNTCPLVPLSVNNGTCEVGVTFTPSAAGQRFSNLKIEFNGTASPLTVPLAGIGSEDEVCPGFTTGTPPDCEPIPCPAGFTGNEPDCVELKARISKLTVTGPAKARKGKAVTYKARITNSGNARATGVRLKVSGRGIASSVAAGTIEAGKSRTVKVKIKPKKPGKVKATFKVSSSNAGGKSVRKTITVRR